MEPRNPVCYKAKKVILVTAQVHMKIRGKQMFKPVENVFKV